MGNCLTIKRQQEQVINQPHNVENSTCEICFQRILTRTNKFRNGDLCSHQFCIDCLVTYIQTKLENNVARIHCPDMGCTHKLDPLIIHDMIPPQVFVKWCDLLCESTVLGLERCYCPNSVCSALVLNECGGKVKKAKCPNCTRLFCFQCKQAWHAGFNCGKIRDENEDVFGMVAERMGWKTCPRCFQCVERVAGCSWIICRCKARFCYSCGKLVTGSRCGCHNLLTDLV